jgi:hypothetical protein
MEKSMYLEEAKKQLLSVKLRIDDKIGVFETALTEHIGTFEIMAVFINPEEKELILKVTVGDVTKLILLIDDEQNECLFLSGIFTNGGLK